MLFPCRRSKGAFAFARNVLPSPLVGGGASVTGPTPNPGVPMSAPVYVMPVKYMGSTLPLIDLYGVSHWPTKNVPHVPLRPTPVLREARVPLPASTGTPDSTCQNAVIIGLRR